MNACDRSDEESSESAAACPILGEAITVLEAVYFHPAMVDPSAYQLEEAIGLWQWNRSNLPSHLRQPRKGKSCLVAEFLVEAKIEASEP